MRVVRVMLMMLVAAPVWAQRPIPLRTLTTLASTDSGFLKYIHGVRQLPDGRVLVNDPTRHQLLAFDSALKRVTPVLDTIGGSGPKYGAQFAFIITYLGDSTLFVDRDAQAFVVIDPAARVIRTIAVPRASDVQYIVNSFYGVPAVDSKGRLIYRTPRSYRPGSGPPPRPTVDHPVITYSGDTVPILRSDFDARTVDTVAFMRGPVRKGVNAINADGRGVGFTAFNPLPSTDEWAVTSDGTLALVRVHDYHVDWLSADGTMTATPKMIFDWKRITLEDKVQIIDSMKKAHDDYVAKNPPQPLPPGAVALPFVTVDATDLPDFYPPVRQGHVFADRDNNLWILPSTTSLAGNGLVWDIVNRQGEVFQRVRLPEGRDIAGFGPGGVVYLKYVVGEKTVLERARVSSQ